MIALVRTEAFKTLYRRRTVVIAVLLVVLPAIIVMSIGDRPPRPRDLGDDVGSFRLMRISGLLAAPALLRWQFDILLLFIASLFAGDAIATNRTLLYALLVMPIWGISSVVAALSAYSAEIFPTALRSRGAGLAAGFSKAGGVLIIALVALALILART